MAINVQKTGVITPKISAPPVAASSALTILGEATDMYDVQERAFYHNVPGDRNGGPQGPPIEVQDLGSIFVISFALSSFDPVEVDKIRQRARTTLGAIDQADIGNFLLLTGSFRICLDPTPDDATATADVRNFWCCLARDPIGYNLGTKFQEMRFQFEAHKAPPTHVKAGIIQDTDNADLPP